MFRSFEPQAGFTRYAFSTSSRLTRVVAAVLVFALAWLTVIVTLTLLSHARWPVANLMMLTAA
jgi:hypothetical protein